MVRFRSRYLSTTQTPCDAHFDTFSTQATGILHYALHRPAKLDLSMQLLRNVLRHKIGIDFRLPDFFNADVHRHFHHRENLGTQLLDIFTLLPDDDTRPRRIYGDTRSLCRTLNLDTFA